jgi:NADPH2:quinone reductase
MAFIAVCQFHIYDDVHYLSSLRVLRAIRVNEFGPPEVMRISDLPDPNPGPGQAVVRVKAAGVNPAETYMRSGLYARKPKLPWTPGSDAGGIVESIGEGVTKVVVGDRVYTSGSVSGTYAEKALCEEHQLHPLLEKLSFGQGAAINVPYATAYRAIFQRARTAPGEWVLVHGASGGVGVAGVQMAHAAGMKVIGTAGTENGRSLVKAQGAEYVLDHQAPTNYLDQIQTLTYGHGIDVILEMLANVNLDKDLKILAMGGRVVVIGSRGRVEIDPRDTMTRDGAILGMLLYNVSRQEMETIHAALAVGLENDTLHPIVGKEIPLAESARAHHEVMEPGAYGKIVLIP